MLRFILISLPLLSRLYVYGAEYGVDCAFPIHYKEFRCDALGDTQKKVYEDYMQGCRDHYGPKKGKRCDSTEQERLEMSLRQPQSMVNYTSTGFKKIRAPQEVRDLLTEHWEKNKDNLQEEVWPSGNIYTNHWAAPTYMASVEDTKFDGAGHHLKQKIWNAAKTTIEAWTGMEQRPTSLYGIRAYTDGAILSPHVDRLPLVSSCIVNVAQDVDEPWPLEVIDRQGNSVNVTMEPGDMVLYESGSLIHGRPFPLKGRYFANIFIHFEPTGRRLDDHSDNWEDKLDDFWPPYLLADSPASDDWARKNPQGFKKPSPSAPVQQVVSPEGHSAAAIGDVDGLSKIATENADALHAKDRNGWQPIHEAARGGHMEAMELLVKHGADINARTGRSNGASPLNIALASLNAEHPVAQYLISLGAEDIEQEL